MMNICEYSGVEKEYDELDRSERGVEEDFSDEVPMEKVCHRVGQVMNRLAETKRYLYGSC